MKRNQSVRMVLAGAILCAGAVSAQDKITVPLRDPARPATVVVNLIQGSVSIKGYSGKEVLIDSTSQGPDRRATRRRTRDIPEGMHRVDIDGSQLDVVEDNNVVTVRGGRTATENMSIQVPTNTSVKLRVVNGGMVSVEGISGEIDVDNVNGNVAVAGATGPVLAHSTNGKVSASLNQLPSGKPVSLSTMNGDIDLTLPGDAKTKIVMKTENGDIVTDFDIKIDPTSNAPIIEDNRDKGGKYRIRRGRTLTGTINGGGTGDIQITSYNGRLMIQKKK